MSICHNEVSLAQDENVEVGARADVDAESLASIAAREIQQSEFASTLLLTCIVNVDGTCNTGEDYSQT